LGQTYITSANFLRAKAILLINPPYRNSRHNNDLQSTKNKLECNQCFEVVEVQPNDSHPEQGIVFIECSKRD
jgi:hypothetical protein